MWRIRVSLAAALLAVAAAGITISGPAQAEGQRFAAVAELFTSQGCSSCPPADKLFQTYVQRPDVLALTFPVDYWDYLGWKDTFASPQHSERQRSYAKARGDGSVYTPQVVINGRAHAVGSRKKEIDKTIIAMSRLAPLSVPVQFQNENGAMTVDVGESQDGGAPIDATVWIAGIQKSGKVNVRRGENGGRSLTYVNIVRQIAPVGMWSGSSKTIRIDPMSIGMDKLDACVALVQMGRGGPIVGAAWMDW